MPIEASQGATSTLEALLEIQVPPDWKQSVIHKYNARIEVHRCLSSGKRGCRNLVELRVDPSHVDDVLAEVRRDPKVLSSDLVGVSPGVLKGVVESHECVGCRTAVGFEAFIIDARMDDQGRMVQRLIAQDRDAVRRIIDRLEKRGHRVELKRLTTLNVDELLTTRQEDVVEMAWEMGYYDRPRRTGLREMAGALGVSISTMSEILRKAQRKIMEDRFGGDDKGP